jgi:hypothetical protein
MNPAALRIVATVVMALATLVVTAGPAGAHAIEGVDSTNYRTRITERPDRGRLSIEVVEAGSRLELVNRTGDQVIVFGYQDEPYLRVDGDGGVFQNRLSPATYINADRQATLQPPADADPSANPEWERIDDGFVVRWHDHRAHWMGARDAPAVRRAPGETHVVIPRWEVPIEIDGERSMLAGDLTWIPGPSPAPWYALAGILALAVGSLAFLPRRRTGRNSGTGFAGNAASWGRAGEARVPLALAVGLLVVLDLVHIGAKAAGGAGGIGAGIGAILSGSFFSIAAWGAGILSIKLLLGRSEDGPFAAAFAGAVIALFGGVADISDLSRSQLPVGAPDFVARLLVSASMGIGLGLVIAAIVLLRLRSPAQALQRAGRDGVEGGEPGGPQRLDGLGVQPVEDLPPPRVGPDEA